MFSKIYSLIPVGRQNAFYSPARGSEFDII